MTEWVEKTHLQLHIAPSTLYEYESVGTGGVNTPSALERRNHLFLKGLDTIININTAQLLISFQLGT